MRIACPVLLLTLAVSARPVAAQDTTSREGVRIGLTYAPGTKPGVVVLPVAGLAGDSIRAIVSRDLDYGDRISVVGGDVRWPPAAISPRVNYPLFAKLGAAALVQVTLTSGGARVAVHDVAARRVAQTADLPLSASAPGAEWRMSVHGLSDEVERWITGTRGVARTRVAYVQAGQVRVVDADGAADHAVTERGLNLSPAWHPSGRYLAYTTFVPRGGTQVMVRDVVSGRAHTASNMAGLNITPAFSPDGRVLVYAHGEEAGTDLYATNGVDGGAARRITVGRGTDNVSPSFSPDGRRLAFTSGRSGHPEVYITDVDGTDADLLTLYAFGDQNYRSNPDWSPDGRTVAFQSQLGGQFQVMTISLRDRSVKQLTSEGSNEDPSWAPDGRHLVFTTTRTGAKQLYVMDVESGRVRQLTRGGGVRLAAWSPRLGAQ